MTIQLIRKVCGRQPQKIAKVNNSFPIPKEVFIPHLTRTGILYGTKSTSYSGTNLPTKDGVGVVVSTGASYGQNFFNGGAPEAWMAVAYRDNSASSTQSLIKKNGSLVPIQESAGTVRCVPFPDRTDPVYTSNIEDCKNRVNFFGGRINGISNALYFNNKVIPFSATSTLSSSVNDFFIGSSGGTSEASTSWAILLVVLWQKSIPSHMDMVAFSKNPWQIFEPETIPLFYSTSGGGATDLSIFDALHSHAGDNLTFSLDTYLAAQDSTHAHAADNLTLDASTAISLILSDALHGLSSDVIAFITGSYLQVADSLHGHSADVLSLATASFLAVADALHSHSAENLTLDTSNSTQLTLQDATHSHSADNNVLTLDTWLAIVDAVHAHSADNVSISSEERLAIADALHALASDALILTLPSPPGTCPTIEEIVLAIWNDSRALTVGKFLGLKG